MNVTDLHLGVILVHKDRLVQIVRIDKGPKIIVRDLINNTLNVAFSTLQISTRRHNHTDSAREIFGAALSASAREWISRMDFDSDETLACPLSNRCPAKQTRLLTRIRNISDTN
jgi:hypothetical protein